MPGDGRSPRRVASMDASLSIGQLTSMINTRSHTADKLVSDEQAQGRKAHQASEAEASEMRQQVLMLEHPQSVAVDAHQRLLSECQVYRNWGRQQMLDNRMLMEQNLHIRALMESI
eukprot:12929846-Prorocentrum_lima.AAC.1